MTFDFDISENVNLSNVLDCLLNDNENFDIIQCFLDKYSDTEKHDIFRNSLCIQNILNADYVLSLKYSQIRWIFDNLNGIDKYEYPLCLLSWQILKRDADDSIKAMFRNYVNGKLGKYGHPYSGRIGREMERDENIIFLGNGFGRYMTIISSMTDAIFTRYIKNHVMSIYQSIIFSYGFFMGLGEGKQYLMLKELLNNRNVSYFRYITREADNSMINDFLLQMLCSDCDIGIKKMIYNGMKFDIRNENIEELYRESSCVSELIMKVQLMGEHELLRDLIIFLMSKRDINALIELYDFDSGIIEDNFNICDLIESFKDGREKR